MKFPDWIKVYGDREYRGDCPHESSEQVTFFAEIRRRHPDTWGKIALHPRNEGKRSHHQAIRHKLDGLSPGAPDIVIPGKRTFCCELKRRDHTKSTWARGQEDWLKTAHDEGAFVCVALGYEGALQAFEDYINEKK